MVRSVVCGRGAGGDGAVDAVEERVDFELVPWHTAVGVGLAVTAQHVGQRLLELRPADRVELDMGVHHPGFVVGPLADLGPRHAVARVLPVRCGTVAVVRSE